MSNNPVDRAIDEIGRDFEALIHTLYRECVASLERKPESPIEEAALAGFCAAAIISPSWEIPGLRTFRAPNITWFKLEVQPTVLSFRPDFLVTCSLHGNEFAKLIVECDGFDFHDRTKESAQRDKSRDRDLTSAGYRVLRFTGSEIYKAPLQLAGDVMKVGRSLAPKGDAKA